LIITGNFLSLRRGFKNPFERYDFDFLFFLQKKQKIKIISLSPFFAGEALAFVTSPKLSVIKATFILQFFLRCKVECFIPTKIYKKNT
jgi:hypothetical protein